MLLMLGLDITPTGAVTLAGSPIPMKTCSVDTRLFVKAMVISAGKQSLAIVTQWRSLEQMAVEAFGKS